MFGWFLQAGLQPAEMQDGGDRAALLEVTKP